MIAWMNCFIGDPAQERRRLSQDYSGGNDVKPVDGWNRIDGRHRMADSGGS
jgi:hypothetical protein